MSKGEKIMKEVRLWIFSILVAFCIVSVVNSRVFAKVQVQQSSMENTLYNNDQLIIDKFNYNFVDPKSGEIIIFLKDKEKGSIIEDTISSMKSIFNKDSESEDERLVKRVIGVEGDSVDIRDGKVYVNDVELNEPYVTAETKEADKVRGLDVEFPITVGKDKLFVLGDNRPGSSDSRDFGLIDKKQVEGKVKFRIYPFDKMGVIK